MESRYGHDDGGANRAADATEGFASRSGGASMSLATLGERSHRGTSPSGETAHGRLEPLHGQTVVIKYGGSAMEKAGLRDLFSRDVALVRTLGVRPVVVHGGGPQIDRLMKRLGKAPHFIGGLRVTDDETMSIVEMVLAGSINKEIVGAISAHGGGAGGLCGCDGGVIRAARRVHVLPAGPGVDLRPGGGGKTRDPAPPAPRPGQR